jgi:hypothetical protein
VITRAIETDLIHRADQTRASGAQTGIITLIQRVVRRLERDSLLIPDPEQHRLDISLCPLCGGTMCVIADISDPNIIQKIPDHVEARPPPTKTTVTAGHN